MTLEEIREIKEHILAWKPYSQFSWPDDGLSARPYYYDFHCTWVAAWNAEDRQTECVPFILRWLEQEASHGVQEWLKKEAHERIKENAN